MRHPSYFRLLVVLGVLSLALLACAPSITLFEASPTPMPSEVVPPTLAATETDAPAEATNAPTERPAEAPTTPPTLLPVTRGDLSLHYQAMREGFEGDIDASSDRPRYTVSLDVRQTDTALSVTGVERVRFQNTFAEPLNEIIFRLYPNALSSSDYLFVTAASVNDVPQTPELLSQNTALRLALSEPLNAGESVAVELHFRLDLSDGRLLGAGRIANDNGVVVLSSFLPLLSVVENGEWWTEFPAGNGDPAFSASALFDVTLMAPAHMEVSSSGTTIETAEVGSDLKQYRFVTGPMRDFSVSLADQFELITGEHDGITVNIWSAQGSGAADDFALEVTEECLRIFNEQFGEYPFAEIDVVESPMNGAAGIEYPGVYYVETELWDQSEFFYEVVLVHETAHQWWYSVIGNNQIEEPWIDEALADYSVEVYYRERYGDEAGAAVRETFEDDVQSWLDAGNPSKPIGLPITSYTSPEYGLFVYEAGALLYSHFAQDYGDDAVSAMLNDYFEQFRYGIAHSEDIEALVRSHLGAEAGETFVELVYGE